MMSGDLDWQFGEGGSGKDWAAPEVESRPGFRPLPAYSGLERHPELMRRVAKNGAQARPDQGDFYLKMCLLVIGFLAALYIFV